ncbi:MAG: hypothetical protein AAB917_02315 [Patescibacteria group bacterium]
MEETVSTISPPTIDLLHYLGKILEFFTQYSPAAFANSKSILGFLIGISIPISLLFFIGIIYCIENLRRYRNLEEKMYEASPKVVNENKGDSVMAKRWHKILQHVESKNENDWRQAIIESDIILEDLLVKLGYQGESIGERLRRANKGDFKTLDQAGEAHGVRNRIAHDGSNHPLNQIEARRVINLYKQVFEEFYHI